MADSSDTRKRNPDGTIKEDQPGDDKGQSSAQVNANEV